jgi:hypothetical protein
MYKPLHSLAQLQALSLRLIRRTGWEDLMKRNKCVIGDLYVSSPDFPKSDPGRKLCNVLELPWRNNIKEISAIPPGEYKGYVRTDGNLGWRIELAGTGERKHIQIHIGNTPDDTKGCILPGSGESTDAKCTIPGSNEALKRLRTEYGSSTSRQVVLLISS